MNLHQEPARTLMKNCKKSANLETVIAYLQSGYKMREFDSYEVFQTHTASFPLIIDLNAGELELGDAPVAVIIEGTPEQFEMDLGFPPVFSLLEQAIVRLLEEDYWHCKNPGCSLLFLKKTSNSLFD